MSTNGYGQQNGDIHASIVISQSEAAYGTTRTLNLPDGRTIPVNIPPGAHNGQEIRMEGMGSRTSSTGVPGALILTISIPTAENFGSQPYPLPGDNAPTNLIAPPPPPPVLPSYPTQNQVSSYTSYPAQGPGSQTYSGPSYPSVPVSKQGPTFATNQPVQASKRPPIATITIAALALLIILGGVLYYFAAYQPQQQHVQATATAQDQGTMTAGTAQAVATTTAQVVASATANASPQGIYQSITAKSPGLLNDPLTGPSTNNWDANSNCSFKNGSYHAYENQTGFFYGCNANATNFTHFLYQVKMTFLQGIYGGIFFRSDPNNSKYYLLRFNNTTGDYVLYVYSNKEASSAKTLLDGTSSSFKTGLNQTNVIAVLAKDSTISIYVNSTYVNSVQDSTYAGGSIGVFAENNKETSEVSFQQAQVWNA